MKKLARELSSLYQGGKALLVVPGYHQGFLGYLEQEIDSSRIISSYSSGVRVGITTYPFTSDLRKMENLIIVSNFATPSLVRWADLVIVRKSEELMREKYLSPFRFLSYAIDCPAYKVCRARVDFLLSLGDITVVPANLEEAKVLAPKVNVVTDIFQVKPTRRLVIARRMGELEYLQVRSAILHGGELIDLGGNWNLESWTQVALRELGYFNLKLTEVLNGSGLDDRNLQPKQVAERVVTPRDVGVRVEMVNGNFLLNGNTVGEYWVRGGKLHVKLNCGSFRELIGDLPSLADFISPMSTGRCSLFFSCMRLVKDQERCREMSMEAYLLARNYVKAISRINFSQVIRTALRKVTVKSLMEGITLDLRVMDQRIQVEVKGEADKLHVKCLSCEKFKETSIRVRSIKDNYTKLEKVLKDLLLKEMITFRHGIQQRARGG
ncbi:hypothetical protein [Metallosphaera javensis (ex Sakai et al. 2022)]|uniref:hypothetical protein n=1 Tax=Metallosphaera javensis (ex Sakai et al. 2022) TaxID=2775498 RepID=UPI0025887440|nr:MAG: hypothetical protein MjAS7_1557 [Metallosphaera javensis (ex Sakai et al. 2022)]